MMKDQYTFEDGEKQDKWNMGLDLFTESWKNARSSTKTMCS